MKSGSIELIEPIERGDGVFQIALPERQPALRRARCIVEQMRDGQARTQCCAIGRIQCNECRWRLLAEHLADCCEEPRSDPFGSGKRAFQAEERKLVEGIDLA